MTERYFHGTDVNGMMKIKGNKGYGVSLALAKGGGIETFCSGSGRYGQDCPVNPDMMFQAASISKPVFAMTVLRYADKGLIDIDADISGVISDFVKGPVSFSALLSHTAGMNVRWFLGYRADHAPLTLEDVLSGRGNSPKIRRIRPYGAQYMYSGGGIELAELAFTRITETTLRDAFQKEIAGPLGLHRTGYFQPLDEDLVPNAAFGGRYAYREDPAHGYHYYPERAAAGMWTTPTELTKLGIALSRSVRDGGILRKETARRMVTPVRNGYGLCIRQDDRIPDQVGHTGGNEGFVAYWTLSLTEDLCAAAMFNGSNRQNGAVFGPMCEFIDGLIESEKA
ncbi:MAG: beta-lactamase family protein [Clostridia bacterium]|nr:beta-lactamase family protein [Clostridia bacterium]